MKDKKSKTVKRENKKEKKNVKNQEPTIKTTTGFERYNYKFVETKEIKNPSKSETPQYDHPIPENQKYNKVQTKVIEEMNVPKKRNNSPILIRRYPLNMDGMLYSYYPGPLQNNIYDGEETKNTDKEESNKKTKKIFNKYCPVHGLFRYAPYGYGYGMPMLMPVMPGYPIMPLPYDQKDMYIEEVKRVSPMEKNEYVQQPQEEELYYQVDQQNIDNLNENQVENEKKTVASNYLFYDANTGFRTEDRNRPPIKYEM